MALQQRAQPPELRLRRRVGLDAGRPAQERQHRLQRGVGELRLAGQRHRQARPLGHFVAQRQHQPRLADPRLAEQHHRAAATRRRPMPAGGQRRELVGTARERRHAPAFVRRKIAARHLALAQDRVRGHGLGKALEIERTERAALEEVADQRACRVGDHHRAGLGHGLEPRRQVRRLAEQSRLGRTALAVEITDENRSCRRTHPAAQPVVRDHVDRLHRLDRPQPGAHRALGGMLLRARIAEADEQPVAEILRHRPAMPLHHRRAGPVVGGDDVAQILRIPVGREAGEADQVDEHHRHLPPLAMRRPRIDRGPRPLRRADRPEQPPPVADLEADLAQIRVGQFAEHVDIDAVVRQRVVKAGEIRRLQPAPKVSHRRAPHRCCARTLRRYASIAMRTNS